MTKIKLTILPFLPSLSEMDRTFPKRKGERNSSYRRRRRFASRDVFKNRNPESQA